MFIKLSILLVAVCFVESCTNTQPNSLDLIMIVNDAPKPLAQICDNGDAQDLIYEGRSHTACSSTDPAEIIQRGDALEYVICQHHPTIGSFYTLYTASGNVLQNSAIESIVQTSLSSETYIEMFYPFSLADPYIVTFE